MQLLRRLVQKTPRVPEGELVFAVGDIHGRDDLLGDLHRLIETEIEQAAPERATVVYLGDYVDRGPDSKAVIDRLLQRPVKGAESVFLKGNHEDCMLHVLGSADQRWLSLGGGATIFSYGMSLRDDQGNAVPAEALRAQFEQSIPPDHAAFLNGLRLSHVVGDYFFVHAGVRPGLPLENQASKDLLWIRREFLRSRRWHGKRVVHGHSSTREAVVRHNRICVDTMAYATDRLSCLVLKDDGDRIVSVQR